MSEVQEAASHYARRIGGGFLADADNGDGWATLEGGPFQIRNDLESRGKPTWNDQELAQAIQAVSNAFAYNAEGDVVVVLPYDMPDRPSYWPGEFATIKARGRVDKILAFDIKNPSAEPQGQPQEYWPEEQDKTEHAG